MNAHGPRELNAIERAARATSINRRQIDRLSDQCDKLHAACLRLLKAAEGMDSLNDDESRAEAYADELTELDAAKDQARDALNLGIPPSEAARRSV